MNEEAYQAILSTFSDRHGVPPSSMSKGLADTACATSAPYLLMIECLDQLNSEDPTGGLLITLLERTYMTAAGSLVLISHGHLREAEILSRSVLESAATISYIVRESPQERLARFFGAYVSQEREQNQRWKNDLEGSPPEIQQDHRMRIDRKNEALDAYEKIIDELNSHFGIHMTNVNAWPTLVDRLSALDRRLEYRTVYAAMCSQAHHDAEDILNNFMANCHPDADRMAARTEREADTFSIFMVLFGLRWFLEAVHDVCSSFKFPTVIVQAKSSLGRLHRELEMMTKHLDSGEFPETWTADSALSQLAVSGDVGRRDYVTEF